MAKRTGTIAVPASVSAGAAIDVSDLVSVRVQVSGTFDATYVVEYSEDGTHWVACANNLTIDTAGEVSVPDSAKLVRVNCPSDWTSGTPTGTFGGVLST